MTQRSTETLGICTFTTMDTDDVLPEGVALVVSDMYEKVANVRKKVDFMEWALIALWVLQVVCLFTQAAHASRDVTNEHSTVND